MTTFRAAGKQVLEGCRHYADCRDNDSAKRIADALNETEPLPLPCDDDSTLDPYEQAVINDEHHNVMRQGDEYYCVTCRTRWGADEGADHP